MESECSPGRATGCSAVTAYCRGCDNHDAGGQQNLVYGMKTVETALCVDTRKNDPLHDARGFEHEQKQGEKLLDFWSDVFESNGKVWKEMLERVEDKTDDIYHYLKERIEYL